MLDGDALPALEVLTPAMSALHKMRDAFLHVSGSWTELPADASERLSTLLAAADTAAPPSLRVPEAVTLALRVAASLGGPVTDALTTGKTAERFGGPGIPTLIELLQAAGTDGWTLRRAFRGTTRRERRNHPALAALEGALDGVWRLGLEKGEERRELMFLAELPIEGRAALPQLLLDNRKRVVVLPIDPELTSWYTTLSGPEPLGWNGDEDADSLRQALA